MPEPINDNALMRLHLHPERLHLDGAKRLAP